MAKHKIFSTADWPHLLSNRIKLYVSREELFSQNQNTELSLIRNRPEPNLIKNPTQQILNSKIFRILGFRAIFAGFLGLSPLQYYFNDVIKPLIYHYKWALQFRKNENEITI